MTTPTGDALKASAAQVEHYVKFTGFTRPACLDLPVGAVGVILRQEQRLGKDVTFVSFPCRPDIPEVDLFDDEFVCIRAGLPPTAALSPVEQAPQPVAWLYTSKTAGDSIVDWRPIDQMALRREDWKWEPLYRGTTAKESGNAD